MKKLLAGLMIGALAASFTFDAEAQRRLGGGRSFGKQSPTVQQRQATPPAQSPQQGTQAAPAQQPAAAAARPGAGPAAAAPRSPWRGALMGLAAGLGIAALASMLGLSETLAMIMTIVLVGLALMLIVGFVLRRMRPAQQPAYGAAGAQRGPGTYANVGYETTPAPAPTPVQRRIEPTVGGRPGSAMDAFARPGGESAAAQWGVPAGFDTKAFLDAAKGHYAKLQQAWDAGNLDELSEFTTNEMFIALTHELRARAGQSKTEVVSIDAELLGIESTADEHIASVKFDGTLRVDGEMERVAEVWNLSKPVRGGGWVLAGIQQLA
ncbi:MAG TPA: Tim44-like domain-containing protein [Burkholderiaceae bacterium]|nr:Tim44-like domain-containing protein [Burkholderiaceae bacterium]